MTNTRSTYRSLSSNTLPVGRFGVRNPVGVKYSTPVQTGPEATQPRLQGVPGPFPGGKAAGAWR